MKKSLSLLLIFSLSLLFLIGCGKTDKPNNAVNNYFSSIKSQNYSDLIDNLISSILPNEDESTTKEAKDTLIEALSKLEVKTNKETIDYSSATVSVNVKGISLSSVMDSLIDEIQNSSELHNLSKDDLSKKITKILIEKIKNSEVKERTCQLNLIKEKDNWTLVTNDDNFFETIWGLTEDQINTLKH